MTVGTLPLLLPSLRGADGANTFKCLLRHPGKNAVLRLLRRQP